MLRNIPLYFFQMVFLAFIMRVDLYLFFCLCQVFFFFYLLVNAIFFPIGFLLLVEFLINSKVNNHFPGQPHEYLSVLVVFISYHCRQQL